MNPHIMSRTPPQVRSKGYRRRYCRFQVLQLALTDLCRVRELKEVALATLHNIQNEAKAIYLSNFYRQSSAKAYGN